MPRGVMGATYVALPLDANCPMGAVWSPSSQMAKMVSTKGIIGTNSRGARAVMLICDR